jgi:hypothetical protein
VFRSKTHPDDPVFAAVLCAEERTPKFSGLLVDRQRVNLPLCLNLPLGLRNNLLLFVGGLEGVTLAVALELGLLGFVLFCANMRCCATVGYGRW